jgi:hypothetical protein
MRLNMKKQKMIHIYNKDLREVVLEMMKAKPAQIHVPALFELGGALHGVAEPTTSTYKQVAQILKRNGYNKSYSKKVVGHEGKIVNIWRCLEQYTKPVSKTHSIGVKQRESKVFKRPTLWSGISYTFVGEITDVNSTIDMVRDAMWMGALDQKEGLTVLDKLKRLYRGDISSQDTISDDLLD